MTTTPWEIESQEIGIGAARGHTVVLGLGMGWQAANVASTGRGVHRAVVENDRDVIALADAQDIFARLPPEAQDEDQSLIEGDAHAY